MISKCDSEDLAEIDDYTPGTPGIRLYSERSQMKIQKYIQIFLAVTSVLLLTFLLLLYFSTRSQYQAILEFQHESRVQAESIAKLKDEAAARDKIFTLMRIESEKRIDPNIQARKGRVLIFIMLSYKNIQRRQLMRSMQIDIYRNKSYPVDWKFFIGQTPDSYMKQIEHEMKTHNDIVILPHLEDTVMNSITTKFFEILEYIEINLQGYSLICKMDGDAFINLPTLWPEFLKPNLDKQDPTIIARVWDYNEEGATYQPVQPHMNIAFVGLSWSLMTLVNRLYESHFRVAVGEQNLGNYVSDEINLSHYLKEDIVSYNLVAMPHNTSSHFNPTETNLTKLNHIIIPGCIYVHEIKKEDEFVRVASCFNENGLDYDRANTFLKQAPMNGFKKH